MTLYGFDISNNNGPNLSLAEIHREGFAWCEAKVSEGNYFSDPDWQEYRDQATACGMPIIGYHYAIADCLPSTQAARFRANGGGDRVMIDFEANSGSIADYWALVDAFNAIGIAVVLSYLPQWYWSQIGDPDLSQVPGLISSAYPMSSAGYASVLYQQDGGDSGEGWNPYGNGQPVMWQFSDCALIGGTTVDANAFRGTPAQLAALLSASPQGGEMQLTDTLTDGYGNPVTVAQILSYISFHADLTVDALGGAGSRAGLPPAQKMTGHPALGGDDVVKALARIGQTLKIPGYDPTKAE